MATIIEQGDNWVLTLPKASFDQVFLNRLLEYLTLEAISEKSKMTDSDAFQISEDLKSSWWANNSDRVSIEKIE